MFSLKDHALPHADEGEYVLLIPSSDTRPNFTLTKPLLNVRLNLKKTYFKNIILTLRILIKSKTDNMAANFLNSLPKDRLPNM